MFKAFLCMSRSYEASSFKEKNQPNFKIDPFLAHIQSAILKAWDMGQNSSCDDQTIGLQGNQVDKQLISDKLEGGWFLADTLCESDYTYIIYLQNITLIKTILHYIQESSSCLTS